MLISLCKTYPICPCDRIVWSINNCGVESRYKSTPKFVQYKRSVQSISGELCKSFKLVDVTVEVASFHSHVLELSLGALYAHGVSECCLECLFHHVIQIFFLWICAIS